MQSLVPKGSVVCKKHLANKIITAVHKEANACTQITSVPTPNGLQDWDNKNKLWMQIRTTPVDMVSKMNIVM
jgi:hypothetical protein